ncbi:hypothetical protein [Wenzhouxiangella sp. EGI_FJ10409]|uniref:hypothetical protein n=1 Tax=Wenzhouxiangella sp. EGI_FJ10409 TaxID=3243767 RepID=UPI0035DB6580
MSDIRAATISAILLSAMVLAGCQQEAEQRPAPEVVKERAQARWDALVDEEFATAWDYYTPGFRQMAPRDDFEADMGARPVQWNAASVISVECQEEDSKCEVLTEVTYQPSGGPKELQSVEVTRDLREEWLFMDGQWWYSAQ